MTSKLLDQAKERVTRVFAYIGELTKVRTPPTSDLERYDWSLRFSKLPDYPTIKVGELKDEASEDDQTVILRVQRPKETRCPELPISLEDWITPGWEQPNNSPRHIPSRNLLDEEGKTRTTAFGDDPRRIKDWEQWNASREAWADAEIPARNAATFFSDLFKLFGRFQRESEKLQLYLGDGHLHWRDSAQGKVSHPVLMRRAQLEFDPSGPEFIIRDVGESTELYTSLLRFHEIDGDAIQVCKARVATDDPHPLQNGKTTDFLKFFVQRLFENGEFSETSKVSEDKPTVFRDPVLFLGAKDQGFLESIERLIEAVPTMPTIPEALSRIVGIELDMELPGNEPIDGDATAKASSAIPPAIDFLLTKASNKEQERIISRLESTGTVLVQGPPGTGKSHTIANLVGHLLANGKTVLISSQTSKALKVVREKVVPQLRPLCVSVLDNDSESKAQLEESVNGIVSYISRTDKESLDTEISQIRDQRERQKEAVANLEQEALEIRKSEYSDIVVAGQSVSPSEAARRLKEHGDDQNWIPGSVAAGIPIPVNEEGLTFLYGSNGLLDANDELCLSEGALDPNQLFIAPSEFAKLCEIAKSAQAEDHAFLSEYWSGDNQNKDTLASIDSELAKCLDHFRSKAWLGKILEDSKLGPSHLEPWTGLISEIETFLSEIAPLKTLVLKYGPVCLAPLGHDHIDKVWGIVVHHKSGKRINTFNRMMNRDWAKIESSFTVEGRRPSSAEHYEAIHASLKIESLRASIVARWDRQVTVIGGQSLDQASPEHSAHSHIEGLKFATSWIEEIWGRITHALNDQGLGTARLVETHRIDSPAASFFEELISLIENKIRPCIKARIHFLDLMRIQTYQKQLLGKMSATSSMSATNAAYGNRIRDAVSNLDPASYEIAYKTCLNLFAKKGIYERRRALLLELKKAAPSWASSIETRSGKHGLSEVPNDPERAWALKQWQQALDARLSRNYAETQRLLREARASLEMLNSQYVEKLAWRYQLDRTGLKQRQALFGWQQLQNRITKTGKGKLDAIRRREASTLLKECKDAVPVWIMPLSRLFSTFDLTSTKFDVLILDEASQSDIVSLAAFALARKIVVVGDSEQVTPSAVGQELGSVKSLIEEFLKDIPNCYLYDGRTSIYDLAQQSFGERIRLVEHFRCVPSIIQFSNALSYNGEIKPLREASSSPYSDHVLNHRVEGKRSESGKTNEGEANEIASLICAMSELPEYADIRGKKATIGVISLLGQEQAIHIDSILQKRLSSTAYKAHEILCGDSSQFQGDERDVIFLSMVDSCDDPPLNLKASEDFKKRYNVAASRARNQAWLVHSLNPDTDLKDGDLRLRLIRHFENPSSLLSALKSVEVRSESPFEKLVATALINEGFRLKQQWEVGAYRLDIVVLGQDGKRIAVECDGDRFHPAEKLADDIARQVLLERLGWRFIRIRGSEFFRDQSKTMTRVFGELEGFGIERLGPAAEQGESFAMSELRRELLLKATEIRKRWESEDKEN